MDIPEEEYSIIRQCIDGNPEAYAILVRRYQDMIYNVTYRILGDPEGANDMAQETFISAYMALKDFKNSSKFSSWLCSIAINKCRDNLRSRKDSIPLDDIEEVCASNMANPEEMTHKRQVMQNLQRALNALPRDYKEVIILKHVEGLDYREMETILGVSANVLKVRTYRARETLKEILKEEEGANE